MERKYTKLDANNIAVIETEERRSVLNIETLRDQRKKLMDEHHKQLAVIDEALMKFEELVV